MVNQVIKFIFICWYSLCAYICLLLISLLITAKLTMLHPSGVLSVRCDALGLATFHISGRINHHNVRIRVSEKPNGVLARPGSVCPSTLPFSMAFLFHASMDYLVVSFGILRLKVVTMNHYSLSLPLGCRLFQLFCNK
jgi:hypothetical protein